MYDILSNLLWYFRLSDGATTQEIQGNQYVSITKYTELKHPVKCNGSYVDTFKSKNYHYYFDQSITKFSQKSK